MAIIANSLANVYASLDAYLQANLLFADLSPIPLQLHGVRRFLHNFDLPWVEAHYDFLTLGATFMNRAGQQAALPIIGSMRSGYLQLNAFQRARTFSQRYTTASIRDVIVGAFPDGEIMPVYDYVGSSMVQEGSFIFDGTKDHVMDTGYHSGIVQHVVQIETRYLELYTRSA